MNGKLDPRGKLTFSERAGYSFGGYGINITFSLLSSFLLVYYISVAGADPAVAAGVIAISRVFDGVSDLIMGYIVDHTKSKFGKARPWIFRLCLPLAVCTVLMFGAPSSLNGAGLTAYMFITYNLVATIFYTGMSVPFNSMNGFMTLVQYERGLLGNLQFITSTAATMTLNTILLKMTRYFGNGDQYTHDGWRISIAILMAAAVVCNVLCFMLCRERVTEGLEKKTEVINDIVGGNQTENRAGNMDANVSVSKIVKGLITNPYWIIVIVLMFMLNIMMSTFFGSGVYFAQYRLNNTDLYTPLANAVSMAQIITMFITPFVMKKLSKRNLCITGLILSVIGFGGTAFAMDSTTLLIVMSVVKGIGFGAIAAPMYGMLQDSITYGEWRDGFSAVGMGNAAASFCQKIGSGLGAAILGWILAAGNFSSAPTSPSSLTSINFAFIWVPAICTLVTLGAMIFYNLDKKYDKISADLTNGRHKGDEE
ncbi:MFS transporter [Clostridium sp. AF19-22AC]|jgi:GPH family glycoside/pentoside/hexuronide:cation symporter|uniref:MFS transporter n=1 Tax=Clostridia TaxID=186801 RepID=UPI000E4BFACC|nr:MULTISPECIES: MFS transporter [Clostridia]RHR26212.1 MFS transporter [Clostridium sp. AF19-22AC]